MSDRTATRSVRQALSEAKASAADLVFLPAQLRGVEVRAELAQALSLLWSAVHHVAVELHAEFELLPPKEAIARSCRCHDAFDAIAGLAALLEVQIDIPEAMWRYAPSCSRRGRGVSNNDLA